MHRPSALLASVAFQQESPFRAKLRARQAAENRLAGVEVTLAAAMVGAQNRTEASEFEHPGSLARTFFIASQ